MPYIVQDKINFLSEAGKILSSNLDYNVTLAVVAKLVVNNVADFCLIDIIERDEIKRLAARVSDPEQQDMASEFFNYPPDPTNRMAIYDAASQGRAIVIKRPTPKWLASVSKFERERELVLELGMQSLIFCPLISRGKVIGVMTIASMQKGFSYSSEDAVFIEELGDRIGIAVDNARLYSQSEENLKARNAHSSMLRGIYASAVRFLAPQSLKETYETIIHEALRLTQAQYGMVLLERNGELNRVYTNMPASLRKQSKDDYAQKSFNTGRTQVLSGSVLAKEYPDLAAEGIKSMVMIPLSHHKQSIGVLTLLATRNKHFNKERLEAIHVFGGLVSLAVQKTKLYNESQSAVQIRDLFISMAAHELRTPTTTIQGYAQMIKKKSEKDEAIPSKWVEILFSETQRLNNLLQELLQINQIRTGQFIYDWKKNSLREIAKRVIDSALITHPKHKVVIEDRLPRKNDTIVSDFDKIMQAVINLVNNAVKFSPIGATIKIILSEDKDNFIIEVEDRGEGISPKDLPHIFEGFYKGREHTKEGMGLGLYLTENIVERHNGNINIKSKLGEGTTVTITLPKKRANG